MCVGVPTVAFIGPGPLSGDPVLYVGGVFTGATDKDSEYWIRLYAAGVSSRALSQTRIFNVAVVVSDVSGAVVGTFASLTFDAAIKYHIRLAEFIRSLYRFIHMHGGVDGFQKFNVRLNGSHTR
jgi:hypothetical protein